jgi:hypothetical protein
MLFLSLASDFGGVDERVGQGLREISELGMPRSLKLVNFRAEGCIALVADSKILAARTACAKMRFIIDDGLNGDLRFCGREMSGSANWLNYEIRRRNFLRSTVAEGQPMLGRPPFAAGQNARRHRTPSSRGIWRTGPLRASSRLRYTPRTSALIASNPKSNEGSVA